MAKEFYKERLEELKSLVEKTEIMIDCGTDDLINLLSLRTSLKTLVEACNMEISERLTK